MDNNKKNDNKLNNNEILRRIQLRDNDYVMLFVGLAIIFLVIIFIYNEFIIFGYGIIWIWQIKGRKERNG